MRFNVLLIALVSTLLIACCGEDSIQTASYPLTSLDTKLIPYELGEQIEFKHTKAGGYNCSVMADDIFWKDKNEFCEYSCCPREYHSFQVRNVRIASSNDEWSVHIAINQSRPASGSAQTIYSYRPYKLEIEIKGGHNAFLNYDSLGNFICYDNNDFQTTCLDSITINNKKYYQAVKTNIRPGSRKEGDVYPTSLIYSHQGLLQINFSDGENLSVN